MWRIINHFDTILLYKKKLNQSSLLLAVWIVLSLLLTACASQPLPASYDPPGFFSGLFNGFTILFALIGHLFSDSIRIYAFPNSGGWYDFSFFLGASMFLGGGGASSRR
jgi:hypothetical protein